MKNQNVDNAEFNMISFLDKYSFNVQVNDPGLKEVINLKPAIVPKSSGLFSQQYFGRTKVNLIERLITHLMVPGHKGKKHLRTSKTMSGRFYTALNIVDKAFDRIAKSGKNPIEVFVRAVENAAPKEEIMTLLIAGQRIPKQVDTSPLRRLDLVLRWIAQSTFQLLADILTSAANNVSTSPVIMRKLDLEKQAASNR